MFASYGLSNDPLSDSRHFDSDGNPTVWLRQNGQILNEPRGQWQDHNQFYTTLDNDRVFHLTKKMGSSLNTHMQGLKRDSERLNDSVSALVPSNGPLKGFTASFVVKAVAEGGDFGFQAVTEDGQPITTGMLRVDPGYVPLARAQLRVYLESLGVGRRDQRNLNALTQLASAKAAYRKMYIKG